jgi:benzoyl-CoA reductase/2-hydroxyglutaryl-CoA dehydratase subunit BcrC/BadD/HgdB
VETSRESDPLDRLAESMLGPQTAPLRSPAERKARHILEAARRYRGEGVIYLIPKYCDPMLFDRPTLTDILKENGLPVLCLEISGALPEGQIRTRVEAFVEMIAGR